MARQYKLARKMKKITLTAAARELGVTQPALSSWESERKAPSIEALIRMAKFYGVTTDFLLGLSQEADPRKDWLAPIDPSLIPVLHETPVFSPTRGWAFVDAVTEELHFANGETLPASNLTELYSLAVKPSSRITSLPTIILFPPLVMQLNRREIVGDGILPVPERHFRWTGALRRYRLMMEVNTTLPASL